MLHFPRRARLCPCPAACPSPPPAVLQVLFSTETFAMGLNMPARTAVFTALQKWDGEENRCTGGPLVGRGVGWGGGPRPSAASPHLKALAQNPQAAAATPLSSLFVMEQSSVPSVFFPWPCFAGGLAAGSTSK